MAVDHYNLYLDNTLVLSVPVPLTTTALHGLPAGSLHDVQISSVDDSGNESARSSLAEFIVIAPAPVVPPQLAAGRVYADPLDVEAPQLAFPYRLTPDGFEVDEDSTHDEYVSIVWFTARTPIGFRPESPDHGTTDLAFQLHPGRALQAAVDQADDRISALVDEERDPIDAAIAKLTVLVAPPGADQ